MIPGVTVNVENGLIGGNVATSDNVTGVVLTGAGTGTLALNTPVKVVSVADAIQKGITKADEPEAYDFVAQFYALADNVGVATYIMLAANTSSLVSLCDQTNESGLKKLIDFSGGTIRNVGVSRTPDNSYTPATAGFIDSDAISAGTNAQAFKLAMAAKHTPVNILINARVADVSNATIVLPNTLAYNGVSYVVGSPNTDGYSALGTVLGQIAKKQAHECLGKVKLGALPVNAYYIGGLPIQPDQTNPAAQWYQQIDQLVDGGFITIKSYAQRAGYFISNDPMACPETDDLRTLANNQVIDKASIIAYQTYVDEINDDVNVDKDGNIDPADAKGLEGKILQAIKVGMSNNISGDPSVYIPVPQNLVTGSNFLIQFRITPKGYLKSITINLGFQI